MTTLEEVPGARERPSNCPISLTRADDGTLTVRIPPRGVSPFVWFFSAVLLVNLGITLYTGLVLFITHRSVLFMAQISPGGLPVSLTRFDTLLVFALLLAVGLGLWTLAAILRPVFERTQVTLDRDWLRLERWEWGRVREWRVPRSDVRGFHLRRDPLGMDSSTLTVQARGEEREVGEFLREADREWLASAGNALLRD